MARSVRIHVRVARERTDLLVAEAWEAGILGLEERDDGTVFLLYSPAERARAVWSAACRAVGEHGEVGTPEPVEPVEWSTAWQEGLEAIEISPRLVIRPPFVAYTLRPGQQEVRIHPGQAFGTGAHPSTQLALVLLDHVLQAPEAAPRSVLDVGTGSGVLALAALRLGAERVVAVDLDPQALREARGNEALNEPLRAPIWIAGSLDSLAPACFDVVVANLLSSEALPWLPELAARVPAAGRLILSGLLASERGRIVCALGSVGLVPEVERCLPDPDGERWWALTALPAAARARTRAADPGSPQA